MNPVTEWRKTPSYQGGFLLDGGVHFVAALRLILGPDDPITTLSAQTRLLQEHLQPLDTVDAVLKTKSGATGVFSVSFGSDFKDLSYEFASEGGTVTVTFDGVTVNGVKQDVGYDGRGVKAEVVDFAASLAKGGPLDARQAPEQALADLEILEKLLKSGEKDGEKIEVNLQV